MDFLFNFEVLVSFGIKELPFYPRRKNITFLSLFSSVPKILSWWKGEEVGFRQFEVIPIPIRVNLHVHMHIEV